MGLQTESFMSESEESYDVVFNSNLKAPFFLVQEAIPELEKTKGKVVIISSIGSSTASSKFIVDNISKAGLDHMTRCLVLDLGPKSIRINTVNAFMGKQGILLERRSSSSREQTNVVAFLASEDSNFVTGQCVKVDGGVTLTRVVTTLGSPTKK
ncbi:dehydrogenase/reductase SDR family member 4 [Aplysia californica]|uniref:Dehydrogenase/reductase SDR family member 4 n=1 Tax=Aplysia californica TaxID=6500 RepID=A0ABM0K2J6_APLCA|nr:dehydrogenase/reductase SDR family member 4 [Aplysia californica]